MKLHVHNTIIQGDDAFRAVQKCLLRNNRQTIMERSAMIFTLWLGWEIIKEQQKEIERLRDQVRIEKVKNMDWNTQDKKGD